MRSFLKSPLLWICVGYWLQSAANVLKPFAGAEVRVPMKMVAPFLMLAGFIALGRSQRVRAQHLVPVLQGVGIGLLAGAGSVLTSRSITKVTPPSYGIGGLLLLTMAMALTAWRIRKGRTSTAADEATSAPSAR